jgi:capsule polysaccharide export protein KpsE/RkpR
VNMSVGTQPSIRESADVQSFWLEAPNWLYNLHILWNRRLLLLRIAGIALISSVIIAFVIPKTYVSQARIMPPEMSNSNSALLASMAARAFGSDALGGLAASLIGAHNSGALFIDLMRSGSVTDRLVEQFQLQHLYHKRYRVDAAKALARRTTIVLDKKSGVITLSVKDRDPRRARDMAQAYLDGLNVLVIRTGSSSAHQERVFIERRLQEVKANLAQAEEAMSDFSSTNTAIDLKEQARVTVESQARVQGELIVAESELASLRQIYGDGNVRVRESEAQIADLRGEITKIGGTSAPLTSYANNDADPPSANLAYLPLRQVPRLAVPYADLLRQLTVQETVYKLLIQQYEIARIQEAKDIPVVNVIDAPGIPEKKSFPPRILLALALTVVTLIVSSFVMIFRHRWLLLSENDPRRLFAREVIDVFASMRSSTSRRGVES